MIFGIIRVEEMEPEDVLLLQKSVELDPTQGDVKQVLEDCINGDATLWRGRNGKGRLIMVTQIKDTDRGRELLTWHLGGTHLNMLTAPRVVQGTLERYAERLGCDRTVALCVPDMVSVLAGVGYEAKWVRMEKEVRNG